MEKERAEILKTVSFWCLEQVDSGFHITSCSSSLIKSLLLVLLLQNYAINALGTSRPFKVQLPVAAWYSRLKGMPWAKIQCSYGTNL
jgi:hypothetical protein